MKDSKALEVLPESTKKETEVRRSETITLLDATFRTLNTAPKKKDNPQESSDETVDLLPPMSIGPTPPQASKISIDWEKEPRPPFFHSDVRGEEYALKPNETVETIARTIFGPHLAPKQLANFIDIVRIANDIPSTLLSNATSIRLPVRDASGTWQLTSKSTLYEFQRDGSAKIRYSDYSEVTIDHSNPHHLRIKGTGEDSADRFEFKSYPSGALELRDGHGNHLILSDEVELKEERNQLIESMKSKGANQIDLARFHVDLAKFESRFGVSSEPLATYKAINRLLKDGVVLSESHRAQLAMDVMQQAATASSVDQGYGYTCGPAVLEVLLYHDSPSIVASLLADIAVNNRAKAADGTEVSLDQGSLAYALPSLIEKTVDGQRSLASRYFQIAAVNIALNAEKPHLRYENRNTFPLSEYLIDKETGRVVSQHPSLSDAELSRLYQRLAGEKAKTGAYFIHSSISKDNGHVEFSSEQDFNQALQEAKRENRFPVILSVDIGSPPFTETDRISDKTGSRHVLTIWDYIPGDVPKLRLDDQSGSWKDRLEGREATVNEVYLATLPTEDADKIAASRFEDARTRNIFDPATEIQRLERNSHLRRKDALLRNLLEIIDFFDHSDKRSVTLDPQRVEFNRMREKFGLYARTLSETERATLRQRLERSELMKI